MPHSSSARTRGFLGLLAVSALLLTTSCSGTAGGGDSESEREREAEAAARAGLGALPANAMEKYLMISGADPDEAARESKEAAMLAAQYAEAEARATRMFS